MQFSSNNKTPRTDQKPTPMEIQLVKSPSLKSWETRRKGNDHYEVTFFENQPIQKQRTLRKTDRTNSLPR